MSDEIPIRSRGDLYALSALRNKRATIAAEIVQLERQVRHRKELLVHVDATLRLLDPAMDIDAIPNKRPPQRIKLFRQGELVCDSDRTTVQGGVCAIIPRNRETST